MAFLKAEWRKLILANYEIDPTMLKPYVPFGTELDFWNDTCYISVVGFMFLNTKVLGVKVPFHVNFPEINLRFYVKRKENGEWKRGVVFIKEIVPKHLVSFIANTVYKENYQTLPMKHLWFEDDRSLNVIYEWRQNGQWNKLAANCNPQSTEIIPDSEEEFITEHYWGYAIIGQEKSTEYEVIHPKWKVYNVNQFSVKVDFGATYGADFDFLSQADPVSVMLAEGSLITVEGKNTLTA
jgi:uncharacterized protein